MYALDTCLGKERCNAAVLKDTNPGPCHPKIAMGHARNDRQDVSSASEGKGNVEQSSVLTLSGLMQEATAQLRLAQAAEQPVALQIVVVDDSSSRVAAILTPVKTCSSSQSPAAAELESVIQHAAQQLNRSELHMPSSDDQTDSMSVLCTPSNKVGRQAGACATPEARAAAAHLLRGLGMSQSLSLELGFDLEPEWPAGPPPSLAASPLVAPAPAGPPMALPAELIRTLNMSTQTACSESHLGFKSELSSSSLEEADFAQDNPRAPHPTPSASQGDRPCTVSAFTLDAEGIVTAFSLAREQLRSTPATAKKQAQSPSQTVSTPASFLLPRSQEAAGAAADVDEVSPVVKTTRQVSSVLAAVADLEAAQGVSGKPKVTRPFTVGTSRFLPPSSADTTPSSRTDVGANSLFPPSSVDRTPANRVSTQFFQPPAAAAVASVNNQTTAAAALSSVGNPLFSQSNMANPLFSPTAASPDPMLTPFYTPASMSSIRTGLHSPASKFAGFGGKEDLAGGLSGSPAGLATPGSGVVTGDWRSVTDRLQALRAQLQSAQKKLKATSEVSFCSYICLDICTQPEREVLNKRRYCLTDKQLVL